MGFPGLELKSRKSKEEQMFDRQMDAQKQSELLAATSSPVDDQVLYQEKIQNADLMRWQQDLDDELSKLRFRLKNMKQEDDGYWREQTVTTTKRDKFGRILINPLTKEPITETKKVEPLANDLFIELIEGQIAPFLSRNLLNSNLNEKTILGLCRRTMDDIADNMADGWDIYDIDFKNFDIVIRQIKNVIIPGPYRALNDGERRHQRTINKRIESFSESARAKANSPSMVEGIFGYKP